VESVVNVGPTQVVSEYMFSDVDRLDAFGNHVQFHGGYAYISYFLTGEHMPWDRETGTLGRVKPFENFFAVCDCNGYPQRGMGAWQVAARYSYADFSDQDIQGGRGRALTLALNWYWNPYARMQFNYLLGDIERNPVGGDYQIAGARFSIDF
jgi:phosphate-selective porin OprO/OprP